MPRTTKRSYKCSYCKMSGHNKLRCPSLRRTVPNNNRRTQRAIANQQRVRVIERYNSISNILKSRRTYIRNQMRELGNEHLEIENQLLEIQRNIKHLQSMQ